MLVWLSTCIPYQLNIVSDYAITQYRTNASEIAHLVRIVYSGLKTATIGGRDDRCGRLWLGMWNREWGGGGKRVHCVQMRCRAFGC